MEGKFEDGGEELETIEFPWEPLLESNIDFFKWELLSIDKFLIA